MRLLHVENDGAAAKAVREMLRGVVTECAWTEFGETALEMARDGQFDLILLDLMLPDIDGFEVAKRLRAEEVDTPFLILSGLVDRDSEFSALAFGANNYLVKPFTRSELINKIQFVLARAGAKGGGQAIDQLPAADPGRVKDDARKYRRFRTIKSAKIDYGPGFSCRVMNISHAGAGLRLLDEADKLPRSFMLLFEGGETQICRVAWRDGERMGVKFIEQAA